MGFDKTEKIGIVGTGMIGMSMAVLFTGNGYDTTVFSMGPDFTESGMKNYDGMNQVLKDRGLITEEQEKLIKAKLHITEDYADMKDVVFVIESVLERLEVKTEVYRKLEEYCPNIRAIASTSSALAPEDLIKGADKYADRIVVAHPFLPPHLVPFVEMVRCEQTDDEAVRFAYDILESTGRKVCLMQKSAPGFIANRLQHALLREAFYMVKAGLCSARDIDKTLMYSFMPRYTSVGLFEHQDAAGLDLVNNIETYLFPDLCDSHEVPDIVKEAVAEGNLGQKTGKGVYEWDEESRADFVKRSQEPYWKYYKNGFED